MAKTAIQKDNLTKFLQMTPEEKQKHLDQMGGHPEYVPQWNDTVYDPAHGIALCKKRGAAFELIRHFGRWEKFNDAFNNGIIALHKLIKPVFYEDFRNIIVENKGISRTVKQCTPIQPHIQTLKSVRRAIHLYTAIFTLSAMKIIPETRFALLVCITNHLCIHLLSQLNNYCGFHIQQPL